MTTRPLSQKSAICEKLTGQSQPARAMQNVLSQLSADTNGTVGTTGSAGPEVGSFRKSQTLSDHGSWKTLSSRQHPSTQAAMQDNSSDSLTSHPSEQVDNSAVKLRISMDKHQEESPRNPSPFPRRRAATQGNNIVVINHWVRALALVAVGVLVGPAVAGPHLGMKLACKRYGEAWNSGSRSALSGQITGDFNSVFNRMPASMFAAMPRGGSGQVLSHSKGSNSGQVTVSTSQGVMTFVLVGNGFNWRVADIYKAGDDGGRVSLKSYLDATVTAHEFVRDLKLPTGTQFYTSISQGFRQSWQDLSTEELGLVREFMDNATPVGKPFLSMNGNYANMTVRLTGDKTARLQLIREGSWKIADYGIESPTVTIASFRNSVDTIASVQRFRSFMVDPANQSPIAFTKEGMLRESLVQLHQIGFLPMNQKPSKMTYFSIDPSGQNVLIKLEDRQVKLMVDRAGRGATIAKVDVTMGKKTWADLSHLIALNNQIRQGIGLLGLAQPNLPVTAALTKTARPEAKPASDSSTLIAASAKEVVATPVSVPQPTNAVAPIGTSVQEVKPTIRKTSFSTPVYESSAKVYRTKGIRKNRWR
jgi:hypothetical protein